VTDDESLADALVHAADPAKNDAPASVPVDAAAPAEEAPAPVQAEVPAKDDPEKDGHTPLLKARGVTKAFAGITAVQHVDLTVEPGERVGLIGPNGAGKTTFFNCLLGVIPLDQGVVEIDGEDVSRLSIHQRAKRGVGRTFQRIELFAEATVREHLLIAERTRRGDGRLWKDLIGRGKPKAEELERCDQILQLLGLANLAERPSEQLSLGQGRLLEVGRALMTEPRILLLDEPSSGLDHDETFDLARTLRAAQAEKGFAVLLVEHDVEFVADFTDRCLVLDAGKVIGEGGTADVLASDAVREAYLGTGVAS
jgi:branched-chain amino acid transport system ATP-binding protein